MPRAKNAKADEALRLYRQGHKLIDIANQLDLPEGTVRRWKCVDHWDSERSEEKPVVRKRGGQPGNRNASGPPGNHNAQKYGLFEKFLPAETLDIVNSVDEIDPLEIIWNNIQIQYAAILRAQKIAYVKNQMDKTIEKDNFGDPFEIQQAWDKHAAFMVAQSRAMDALRGLIKQYDELMNKDWVSASEEQRARIEALRAKTDALRKAEQDLEDGDGVVIINDAG